MDNQFIHNLETDKLELHFSKSAYKALNKTQQGRIKSYFLFSKSADAWVSKGKVSTGGASMAKIVAKEVGLADGGSEGEKLNFVQQQAARIERAEFVKSLDRKGSAQARMNAVEKSTAERDNAINQRYPSPWITGRSGYPESKLRKRAELFDANMRNYIQEQKRYEDRMAREDAVILRKIKSPVYLNNRLEEAQAELRAAERNGNEEAIDDAHMKIYYYQDQIKAIGGVTFPKEVLQAEQATHVMYRGRWYPIVRLNDKTVTFGFWLGQKAESTWQAAYAEIQNIKTDWDNAIILKPGQKKVPVKRLFKKGDMALFTSPYHTGLTLVKLYSVGPRFVTFRQGGSKERLENIKSVDWKAAERVATYTQSMKSYIGDNPEKYLRLLVEPDKNEWALQTLRNREPYHYRNSERGNESLMLSDLGVMGYSDFDEFFVKAVAGKNKPANAGSPLFVLEPSDNIDPDTEKQRAIAKLKLLALNF